MTVKWRVGFDSTETLDAINSISSLTKDGNVSFTNGFAYNEYIAILEEMLDFVEIDNEYIERNIIRETISDQIKKKKTINKNSFISGVIRKSNVHNKKSLNSYYMVGLISIRSIC